MGAGLLLFAACAIEDSSDHESPDDFTIYEFDMPASGNEIIGFNSTIDADGGYVLIRPFYQGGDRSLLVFDTATATAQLIDTGFVVVDAQLLYIEG